MERIAAVKCGRRANYPVSMEDCRKCKRFLREDSEHVTCLRRIRPSREQEKRAKTKAYQCGICGDVVPIPWIHAKYHEEKEKARVVSANLRIFEDNQSSSLRKKLAIYRLYKYAYLSLEEIANLTHHRVGYIEETTSEMFVALCLSDKKCVLRKVLGAGEN